MYRLSRPSAFTALKSAAFSRSIAKAASTQLVLVNCTRSISAQHSLRNNLKITNDIDKSLKTNIPPISSTPVNAAEPVKEEEKSQSEEPKGGNKKTKKTHPIRNFFYKLTFYSSLIYLGAIYLALNNEFIKKNLINFIPISENFINYIKRNEIDDKIKHKIKNFDFNQFKKEKKKKIENLKNFKLEDAKKSY